MGPRCRPSTDSMDTKMGRDGRLVQKKRGASMLPLFHPLRGKSYARFSCRQRGWPLFRFSSFSCPSSLHPLTQRQRPQSSIQRSGTCCNLRLWRWPRQMRLWCWLRQMRLCCSSWQICSCRRSFRKKPSWRPWSRLARSWPFCRQELQWIVRWPSKRRWRRHRGKGTFS